MRHNKLFLSCITLAFVLFAAGCTAKTADAPPATPAPSTSFAAAVSSASSVSIATPSPEAPSPTPSSTPTPSPTFSPDEPLAYIGEWEAGSNGSDQSNERYSFYQDGSFLWTNAADAGERLAARKGTWSYADGTMTLTTTDKYLYTGGGNLTRLSSLNETNIFSPSLESGATCGWANCDAVINYGFNSFFNYGNPCDTYFDMSMFDMPAAYVPDNLAAFAGTWVNGDDKIVIENVANGGFDFYVLPYYHGSATFDSGNHAVGQIESVYPKIDFTLNGDTLTVSSAVSTSGDFMRQVPPPDNDNLTFADLSGWEFWFLSGAGGWSTTVTVAADGSFSGYYHDSDMGVTGDGYPNGMMAESKFSGKFTQLTKVGDYEYSMKCEDLTVDGTDGDQRIEDGVLITTTDPYGFDDADEFRLYLPGKKTADLPEDFRDWVSMNPGTWKVATIDFYGLYNVGGQEGFSSENTKKEAADAIAAAVASN